MNDGGHDKAAPDAAAKIGTLCAADFAACVGGNLAVRILADSGADAPLAGTVLVSAVERLQATMPGSPRTAFCLRLKVADPGSFEVGYALIDLPGKGTVGPLYLERTLPLPSDPTGAYFSVNFN